MSSMSARAAVILSVALVALAPGCGRTGGDGTPVIGATPFRNLFLNTGHGTLGWTMACGSGRYLADLMSARQPQISAEGLDISRYGNKIQESAKHGNPAPAHQ